uniref:Uncharacterized protein n=1 Tax=Anguilla anguilla TaxID=7936 RepID=A0A0E9UL40_ANGAN
MYTPACTKPQPQLGFHSSLLTSVSSL